jgi:predicted transcriptional regulator
MLGFRSSQQNREPEDTALSSDVAKLFFDTFSRRVGIVENSLGTMAAEFEKLKSSLERGQISDLVMLGRLQRAEALIRESLASIKVAVERMYPLEEDVALAKGPVETRISAIESALTSGQSQPVIASHVFSPTGEMGSLPSITTPTELQVLTLLTSEGAKSAPEIGRVIGRSREHTARLMKKLFEEGYIRRDQARIPFRYSVVDRLRRSVRTSESKDEEKEAVSVPQS